MSVRIAPTVAAGLVSAVALVSVGPAEARPRTGHPNLVRAGAYAILGLAVAAAAPRRPFVVAAGVVCVAVALEALQLVTPDRHAHVSDAFVKAVGGLCGVYAGYRVIAGVREKAT